METVTLNPCKLITEGKNYLLDVRFKNPPPPATHYGVDMHSELLISRLSAQAILDELRRNIVDWAVDGTGALMANQQSGGIPPALGAICGPAIREIEELTKMRAVHVMVNRLPAGTILPVHIDPVDYDPIRYHLPLQTDQLNNIFWDEKNGFRYLFPFYWHRVDYSVRHTALNLGEEERVHLIVDLIP